MASNCSEVERSIKVLASNFNEYAGKKDKMNISEFRKMIGKELSHILTNAHSKEGVDELFKKLDAMEDGKISFDEYWKLLFGAANKLSEQIAIRNQES